MNAPRLSRGRVAELLAVEETFLVELEQHDICRPDASGTYSVTDVERVRVSWSMVHELGVNYPGLEVALNLLEQLSRERERLLEVAERIAKAERPRREEP